MPGAIYSLTSTAGQRKGAVASIPRPAAFPMPYEDGFDSARPGTMPRYFADQGGVFEIARRTTAEASAFARSWPHARHRLALPSHAGALHDDRLDRVARLRGRLRRAR